MTTADRTELSDSRATELVGRTIAAYRIDGFVGAGGMGEVYRARDTRLGRDVAIKILPRALVADPDRVARFEREARILAALNHPNIATIHGIEESDGLRALVLELIAGDTLSDRLRRRSLPLAEALAVARQIAEALDVAHEKGIVHRDLKPANVMITESGLVKVLDFGIAAMRSGSSPEHGSAHEAVDATRDGLIRGTAPYMSPEQARGAAVDKRTDIWAFGCVLYEMLTGRAPFARDTTSDTLAAILEREPDWAALPTTVPTSVIAVLKHCLEKDPKLRLRDIGDIRLDQSSGTSVRLEPRRHVLPWVVAALFGVAAVALGVASLRGANPPPTRPAWMAEGLTFSVPPPVNGSLPVVPQPTIAVSHDGRYIVWAGTTPTERPSLWLHTVSDGTTRQLAGTSGATNPFWSPDSRAIGFQSQGMLRTIDVATGALRSLAPIPGVSTGGSWSPAGVIVFGTRYTLEMISATGGEPTVVATLNDEFQENSLRFPRFLPDGRHFVYVARSGRTGRSGAYVASIDGGMPKRLFPVSSHVEYAPPGYLVYMQDEQLVARSFDPIGMTAGPELTTVLSRFGGADGGMRGHFALSDNGVLAYLAQPATPSARFMWVDRDGRANDANFPVGEYGTFRLAPDGRRIVVDKQTARTFVRDVWLLDPAAPPRRVTFGGSDDWQPFWSADGQRVAWMSYRNGTGDFFAKVLDGAAPEIALLTPSEVEHDQRTSGDWAPDGRSVAYWTDRSDTLGDVWVQALDGSKPIAISATPFDERSPRFAPDGHFVAYDSNESGRSEVYVQSFPPTGGKWQISIDGGVSPSWRRDGRELYYINASADLIAVPIAVSGTSLSAGSPVRLFSVQGFGVPGRSAYDPAPDGSRFLVRQVNDPPAQPIIVVLDWTARLNRK